MLKVEEEEYKLIDVSGEQQVEHLYCADGAHRNPLKFLPRCADRYVGIV